MSVAKTLCSLLVIVAQRLYDEVYGMRYGEDLFEKYQEVKSKVVSVQLKLDEAEKDISEGKLSSYEEMRDRIKDTYGV